MEERNCYNCLRKTDCYTKEGLEYLERNKESSLYYDQPCGALYRDYEEAKRLIRVIGEALKTQSKKTQNSIIKFIADEYDMPVYNVMIELEKN